MLKFGEDACETANFVEKMDRFFDCFNVSSFTAGKEKRKPFLAPYRSSNDFDSRLCIVFQCSCTFVSNHTCLISSYFPMLYYCILLLSHCLVSPRVN